MPAIKTYTVTSAASVVLASGLDKKAAAAMVRDLGGASAATFKLDDVRTEFEPAHPLTVGEWAAVLRGAGYMPRR